VDDTSNDILLLDNQLCFALYAASRKVIQRYAPMFEAMQITYTQYITLLVLWEHPALSISELGNYLFLDTGTLTPMLKKMEAQGLLNRTRTKEDERVVRVQITEKGRGLRQIALQYLPTLYCTDKFEPTDLIDLRERLKRLLTSLETC